MDIKKFFKETDKQLHILACFSIAIVVAMAFRRFGYDRVDASLTGWVFSFFFAGMKELYDEKIYKGADVRDWVADIIGYTSGTLVTLVLMV